MCYVGPSDQTVAFVPAALRQQFGPRVQQNTCWPQTQSIHVYYHFRSRECEYSHDSRCKHLNKVYRCWLLNIFRHKFIIAYFYTIHIHCLLPLGLQWSCDVSCGVSCDIFANTNGISVAMTYVPHIMMCPLGCIRIYVGHRYNRYCETVYCTILRTRIPILFSLFIVFSQYIICFE